MPLYEFVCQECRHEQELLVRSDEQAACEKCGSDHLSKLLSVPAAHAAGQPGTEPPPGGCGTGCGCFPS